MQRRSAAVSGATGIVERRRVPLLLRHRYRVRSIARGSRKIGLRRDAAATYQGQSEIVSGDVLKPENLYRALKGADIACNLIKALETAKTVCTARQPERRGLDPYCRRTGRPLRHLSGRPGTRKYADVHASAQPLSDRTLLRTGSPLMTEPRAAVSVGTCRASLAVLRDLTEKLSVMTCPSWMPTRTHPDLDRQYDCLPDRRCGHAGDGTAHPQHRRPGCADRSPEDADLPRCKGSSPLHHDSACAYPAPVGRLGQPDDAKSRLSSDRGPEHRNFLRQRQGEAVGHAIRATGEREAPSLWTGAQRCAVTHGLNPAVMTERAPLQYCRVVNSSHILTPPLGQSVKTTGSISEGVPVLPLRSRNSHGRPAGKCPVSLRALIWRTRW